MREDRQHDTLGSRARGAADLVVVGGGAAGLVAAIHAGRAGVGATVLEGARTMGAKILVAGGGRCNVTHDIVDEKSYAGSTPHAVRKVLRRFDVAATVEFFKQLGVELKREESGKLFPVTDRASSVLDALLAAVRDAGSRMLHPCRVERVWQAEEGFVVEGSGFAMATPRVILATGGKSLPKSGSDGAGWKIARALGHTVTPRLLPALVGLTLADSSFVKSLSGLTLPTTLDVRAPSGKRIASRTASTLCTHFGISGPGPMDISRHFLNAQLDDPNTQLTISWLPERSEESLHAELRKLGKKTVLRVLSGWLPERLVRALCQDAGVDTQIAGHSLSRDGRRALVRALLATRLPVSGTRGWNQAEATAGGVPLAEVDLKTMESRVCPGLFLCGEMLDVDGRIGGYNFQWAWASGFVAGSSAAA